MRCKLFISYKRDSDPDEAVAFQVYQALSAEHDVFIDRALPVGTRWAERIEAELRQADFLIIFLSALSVQSEMVLGEVEKAHALARERNGRPVILPVRLNYTDALKYPLSAYLNPINWTSWSSPTDTPRLLDELKTAINQGSLAYTVPPQSPPAPSNDGLPHPLAAAQPPSLEMPEGTMEAESRFYVQRSVDPIAIETIRSNGGVTLTIKGPRQMGKSSLLIRAMDAAVRSEKRVAFLDFQLIDRKALSDSNTLFRQFCSWLTEALELEDRTEEHWNAPLGNSLLCTRYVSRHVLKSLDRPLVLAMDEVDSIFHCEFRSDFFSMLRSWHNQRATSPLWKRLDLALVTSTEPYQLIENLNQSPFNVGQVIELTDFTAEQVSELNDRHGRPFKPDEESRLMSLLNGHPYLTRRALYLVAAGRCSVTGLFDHAVDDRGPFGDHLRYHLFRLHNKEELIQGIRQVLRSSSCQDDLVFFRLRGAGLVRKEGRAVLPRCALYESYFREHLHV